MTWLVIRNTHGTALVEHHALVSTTDTVISRHDDIQDARRALVAYHSRQEREAAEAAGQGSLWS